ncbi:uncharacterized protein LOC131336564 [Rhododendron vialii]|uniref:uncharacterized protein LOC131336564 n=1 Tax=Rhododendron vialii TaxID=182163 RepID=UPI00265E2113|nr:uncharacterized protein LOC131336564 [Rhododendron vialii]
MACLDMYSSSATSSSSASASANQNSDHKSLPCSSPRISFSNDFAESNHHHHHHHHHHHKPRSDHPPPPPSDFEFSSVSNHSMMSADELFSKGRLLPFKKPTTLREELLTGDDDDDDDGGFSLRPPKGSGSGSTRWKEILGLKKSHIGSRKTGKGDGCGERRPGLGRDPEAHVTKSSQELLNDGRSSSRDVEFGM